MRVKTLISGFDKLCEGGLIKNSVNLVSGAAGTGKSIFAMQFLYNGIMQGDKGLYISFEENLEDLKRDALIFGWDFDRLERERKCRFTFMQPYELRNFEAQLLAEISKVGAKRVVIDSTSSFGMALDSDHEVRKQLFSLASILKKMDCVSLLISEIIEQDKVSRFGVEEFVADAVITLHYGKNASRNLHIVKMRRTNHEQGPVPFSITKAGIEVGKKR